MKRILKLVGVFTLSFLLVSSIAACRRDDDPDNGNGNGNGNGETFAFAGDYEIDITNLGMPLVIYLRIDEDANFMLQTNRAFDDPRDTGTVREVEDAEDEDTYLMVYDETDNDELRTATFRVEDGNLRFLTRMPYGTSNIAYEAEDPHDPEITHYLWGMSFRHEEHFGVYGGSHTVMAMGSEIEYIYTLELLPGLRYRFASVFEMGGAIHDHTEEGSFSIADDMFSLTPEGDSVVEGTIDNGTIEVPIQPSAMAEREMRTLTLTTHAEYAGVYLGQWLFEMMGTVMGDTEAFLILDAFGNYTYMGTDNLADGEDNVFEENGTYDVDTGEGTITFTPEEGEERVGTYENGYIFNAEFHASKAQPDNLYEFVFYADAIQGEFTAEGEIEETEYSVTLILEATGAYMLTILADGDEFHTEEGTIGVTVGMMDMLQLTPAEADDVLHSGPISPAGLNLTFDIDGEEMSFFLTE